MDKIDSARILYIEDDRALRALLKRSLSRHDYSVDVAEDGGSGIETFLANQHDLVILDYLLPDMTGIEIAKVIQKHNPAIPILMVTGAGSEEVAVEALTHGISDYVVKGDETVYLEKIPRAVSYLLENAKLKKEHALAERRLQESEARYRTLLESMPVSMLELDVQGKIISANTEGLNFLNLDDGSAPCGLDLLAVVDAEHQEQVSDCLILAKNGEPSSFEFNSLRGETTFNYAGNFQPIFHYSGDVEKLICTFQDISRTRNLENQLHQSQKMEAIGQLTGGIAHDFNNLLAIIQSNIDVLELKVGEDEFCMERLQAIEKTVDRGSAMTTRLLAYSRKQTLVSEPTALNGLVLGLEDMLSRSLTQSIDLQLSLGEGNCLALFDPNQFENALLNLSLNARDSMPEGGKLIISTLELAIDDAFIKKNPGAKKGSYVRVSVIDEGTGMTTETLAQVFEPFFTTKDVDQGTGLGLSMVYGFAKQSDGYIEIDSVIDSGTRVSLYLPVFGGNREVLKKEIIKSTPVIGSGWILAVEDNPDLREVVIASLKESGYQVVAAEDADQAHKILSGDQQFDLLFTDVVMPGGLSGVDLAEKARLVQPHIRVLFTSGYTESSVAARGKLESGVTLIQKPYKRQELLRMVDKVLSSQTSVN
jgi:PAS domain S-box-containing protein